MKKTQSKKSIIKPEPALVELQRHPESMLKKKGLVRNLPPGLPESLTSHGEPHARFQEVLQELAQARIDKKKKATRKK
jgi:hypothetical protein